MLPLPINFIPAWKGWQGASSLAYLILLHSRIKKFCDIVNVTKLFSLPLTQNKLECLFLADFSGYSNICGNGLELSCTIRHFALASNIRKKPEKPCQWLNTSEAVLLVVCDPSVNEL